LAFLDRKWPGSARHGWLQAHQRHAVKPTGGLIKGPVQIRFLNCGNKTKWLGAEYDARKRTSPPFANIRRRVKKTFKFR
jgi:hypothetical protein